MDSVRDRRAATHHAVVWESVRAVLERRADQVVVDLGGGTGGFAVRVAELGHRVTVIDPSPDALASLERRAADAEVAERVAGVQGDLETVADQVAEVDLVLCHGVLGFVAGDTRAAMARIAGVLAPGGVVSILVAQRHAAVLGRAMAGQLSQAAEILEGHDQGERRFTAPELRDLVDAAGLDLTAMQAVRVFADHVPSTLLDIESGAWARLLELERAVARRPEYLPLATQLHLLAAH